MTEGTKVRVPMNRRHFAFLLPAVVGLMAGCDTASPDATATLLNNAGLQDALSDLSDSIDGLASNMSRLADENWRDVVPDLETETVDVQNAFEKLRQALGVES